MIEVFDEPPASHADAAHVAPVATDAEVLARQQMQADTAASAEPDAGDVEVAVRPSAGRRRRRRLKPPFASSVHAS